jgi:3-dehydroquinate synthase
VIVAFQSDFYNFINQFDTNLEKIFVNTPGARSEILVGQNWESVKEMIPGTGVVIITDDNIMHLYGDKFPGVPVFSVTPGEESKNLGVIENLAGQLLEAGIDRSGFVLAIGGGVVCDLGGFLSSVYMRGIRCGYVSTSLLSQVDASTGGKNGVNLSGTKNMIGVIRQPEFVICDTSMLATLSDDEYLSGLSELIKTAVIGDRYLFETIEKNYNKIIARDEELMTSLVAMSVKFKASVVSEDEMETGLRRILNFGHTYGHAIEMYMSVKHGFAVASGMELAAEFSFGKGLIGQDEKDRIVNMLNHFGLLKHHSLPDDRIEQLVLHDKKKSGSEINFVFTEGIGRANVKKVPVSELLDFYSRYRDNIKKT